MFSFSSTYTHTHMQDKEEEVCACMCTLCIHTCSRVSKTRCVCVLHVLFEYGQNSVHPISKVDYLTAYALMVFLVFSGFSYSETK